VPRSLLEAAEAIHDVLRSRACNTDSPDYSSRERKCAESTATR